MGFDQATPKTIVAIFNYSNFNLMILPVFFFEMIWHENLHTGPARLEPGAVCCGYTAIAAGVFFLDARFFLLLTGILKIFSKKLMLL
jgi:hypothetical protein